MVWEPATVGFVLSVLILLILATKWKLPLLYIVPGAVILAAALALPLLWLLRPLSTSWTWAVPILLQVILTICLALLLALLRFYRDPERTPPDEDGIVLSAADGTVLYTRDVDDGKTPLVSKHGRTYLLDELTGSDLLTGSFTVIGVEMTLLDVHVNRCPVGGRVKSLKHIGGNYISLRKDEAPFVNERVTTVIENSSLAVCVVQVASRLVRRVESYLSVGDEVDLGQRLGIIRFGSLVAVILPKREDVKIEVSPGDRVTAGISVLARYGIGERR
jgi:phosphatidylserine decarboxylase